MGKKCKIMFCIAMTLALAGMASAQSLGDVARKERTKQKPQAARTYTNEDIPSVTLPAEEPKTGDTKADSKDGSAAPADANAADAKDASKTGAEKREAEKTDADKKAALNAQWKSKVASEKANVASIEREINLMQREERLRVAVYYSDAGNRLRDNKDWADQEKKYQDDLASRQKDLAAANAKLDAAREAARKAGASID